MVVARSYQIVLPKIDYCFYFPIEIPIEGQKVTDSGRNGRITKTKLFNFHHNKNHSTVAWVTRPERPKGVKDVVKQARRVVT